MGNGPGEGGLRRRMPLRRGGGGGCKGGSGGGTASSAAAAAEIGSRAMRYYRLWIYTCNTVILAGTLAFVGAAVQNVLLDYRRTLVPSLTLYQPSFLYAYLALATQGGALQLLGCVAAIRLSERLLNAYWLLLLVLLFGDIVIGAFWAFRFEKVCQELKPALKARFQQEYMPGNELATLWDRLQTEDSCCGITGPQDYRNGTERWEMPASCCAETNQNSTKCQRTHMIGCEERLVAYLRSTASILTILGYCVLAFLKLCFLGILRYEIREMIQKIRILRAEMDLTGVNGAVPGAVRELGPESERESLLVRPESVALLSSPMTQTKNPNGNNNFEMREFRSHENI
ncbi:23 kDa integral membrane protein-like [Onthophagus taurus]|uniref:23 kDa integral membrane protein-like n=1 Tax=Onthophagus taurus TaxID=166361 RepID=UPI000C20B3EF|nr:23 kDa integral membrane protein-like [Onthophagus taurus]